jgi:hypothetical protein
LAAEVLASAEHRQQYDKRGLAALGGSGYKLLHDFMARGEARCVHPNRQLQLCIPASLWSSHGCAAAVVMATGWVRWLIAGRALAAVLLFGAGC